MTKLIRQGFDTIELAYRAAIPEKFLLALKEAKSRAVETRKPSPLQWNGVTMLVEATGGQGGYTYRLDTGLLGVIWKFRDVGSRDPWKAHAKIKAHALATRGLVACKENCDSFLRQVGAQFDPRDARIGRADLAFDFYDRGVQLDPTQFVCHAKSSKSEHIERTLRGVRTNYVRFGKLPGKQVCVYDKAGLIQETGDQIWIDIMRSAASNHGIELGQRLDNIWRVELRAGKKHLDQFLKPNRRWDLFCQRFDQAFLEILSTITWRIPGEDANRSRWPLNPIWIAVESAMVGIELGSLSFEAIGNETLAHLKNEYREMLIAQTDGLILTQAAMRGVSPGTLDVFCASLIRASVTRLRTRPNLETELVERRQRFETAFSVAEDQPCLN